MKSNTYYSVESGELPHLGRLDYMGYKFDDIIDVTARRTFREAKAEYKRNLKQMIARCEAELERCDEISSDKLPIHRLW